MSISIQEYRDIMEDDITPDEKILQRISYLGAFCTNIIREELNKTD